MSRCVCEPNFFIVGAPRCGTTAMSTYLSQHTEICFSDPKEPHFFATDMPGMREFTDKDSYLTGCFGHCDKRYAAIGEGSVWYLYSEDAIQAILQSYPAAKFIVMVRNPIDMIASFHLKAIESLDEDITDFVAAWQLQAARRNGQSMPRKCRDPLLLQYARIGKMGAQVQRMFQQVPEAQRLVVVFDDFVEDTSGTYKRVLNFLGVADDDRKTFTQINENRRIRNRFFWEQAWNPPGWLMQSVGIAKRVLRVEKLSILPRVRDMLLVTQPRGQLPSAFHRMLVEEFSADIDLLSGLLRTDLSHWKQFPPA